jgi:hypothetical protein
MFRGWAATRKWYGSGSVERTASLRIEEPDRRLGFTVREYQGGGFGFANRDGVEIHLGVVPGPDAERSGHSAYLCVDDSDELAHEWLAVGAEVHMPEDTEWGQHEGAVVDPDGNVLRFGSPIG